MGSHWLRDLPSKLAGVPNVAFYAGWESRSRSSGGYDQVLGVCIHHTASSASPESDMNYMWKSSSDRPIGAIYLGRDGRVVVGCAGATNTQGKGGPLSCSRGTVPLDKGNQNLIAIEAANNGVGEPWPSVQQDQYVRLVRALVDGYGFDTNRDVHSHNSYCQPSCPGRKIDPAGPSRFGSINASQTWDINAFRAAVDGSSPGPGPGPGPSPTGVEDMAVVIQAPDDPGNMTFAWNGVSINWVTSQTQLDVGRVSGLYTFDGKTGEPLGNFNKAAIQDLIDRCWAGRGSAFPPGYRKPA